MLDEAASAPELSPMLLRVVTAHSEAAREAANGNTKRLHVDARDAALRRAAEVHPAETLSDVAGLSSGELATALRRDTRRPKPPPSTDPLLRDIPAAERRLLETVELLFYTHGIRAVGVDQIISKASVTKATFYKYFAGRFWLEATYAHFQHRRRVEALLDAASCASTPLDTIEAAAGVFVVAVRTPGFRGDALMLAAAEFPDPEHPVRQVVSDHHTWERKWFTSLFAAASIDEPEAAAIQLELAAAGLAAHAALAPAEPAVAAFNRAVRTLTEPSSLVATRR
ncbi:TetR/AcrR family transcriptional regulator (plasmid) [Curtobacterium sp. TC1]|uniref:TetR/AcrR family transcriptional regulator n=1 Tax=Curtobacterium sp. TC1 TaxID=2862880 RepID=UPI001C9A58BC|nr:TetR/AcrR family transcriptional regulator [Curtobacterium sp. TC1]QZQ53771.1 TetR/AcrR family transcriptional regulator [Curtobacterium sp. TC1]